MVPALPLLDALNASATAMPSGPADLTALASVDDLTRCFAHHFAQGAAAERFFADAEVFNAIVSAARSLPQTVAFTGGNAALMADFLAAADTREHRHEVILAARVGPRLKQLLRPGITVPDEFLDEADEYHVIMEYHRGDQWGEATAPQANRFIFSHDRTNAELRAVPTLHKLVKEDSGTLHGTQHTYVISGVHMLEGQTPTAQGMAIRRLERMLTSLPPQAPVHLELASISDATLMRLAAAHLLPRVTSLGLNEQELAFLLTHFAHSSSGGDSDNSGDDSKPTTSARVLLTQPLETIRQLKHIFARLGPDSRLSRIHFHCLTYHLIASHQGHWTGAGTAAAAGSLAASRRACEDPHINVASFDILLPPNTPNTNTWLHRNAVSVKKERIYEFAVAPVLVCKRPTKTVGLGDTISAAGLEYSAYRP
ncbi:hypothetical protein PTSG_12687 [Salpingoeca rosetta]|uniref:ADP-dependent glucokinase n=1 Tax=Salpingoeca rosetta (strain ATCC 50818 / BSB-021) TaxID=946362 RepID=F2UI51_SALR5|nr:uncharacterized protein PTSG_12687 [Salpingoeca rosetta]EGD76800.1 hypothetical protein PTSG_12687 [Salpingoeca rosetta]|eukprot:XP_004991172.1 hypothetical protein PTSG_12687 [Salpingoeca rosetta]